MKEQWKDIDGYRGLYQVSNLGRIKALSRSVNCKSGAKRIIPECFVKTELNYNGYPSVRLVKSGVRMRHRVHILVWEAFGKGTRNGKSVVIDHIDNDKTNCRIDNLQLLSGRENVAKAKKKENRLTGAYFNGKTWFAQIRIKGKAQFLGCFQSELDAHNAYKNKVKSLNTM